MPVNSSSATQKSFVENIKELMSSFHKTGRIGTSHPASKGKANKQAVAIAYRAKRAAAARRK